MKTRILLSGPQILYRKFLRDLLERETDLEVVGVANDGLELLDLYLRVVPDVVCMDADMHRMNGIQVTQRIRASKGEVRVVLYSEQINWPTVWAAVDAGVDGYVCQAASVEEYLRAIRGDTGTGCYFCSQVTAKLLDSAFENTAIPTAPDWGPQVPRLLDNTVPSVRHRYISSALQAASHGQLLDQRKTSH